MRKIYVQYFQNKLVDINARASHMDTVFIAEQKGSRWLLHAVKDGRKETFKMGEPVTAQQLDQFLDGLDVGLFFFQLGKDTKVS